MASIKPRRGPNGRTVYQAQIRRAGYPQKTRTFDRRGDAVTWATEVERAINRGHAIASAEEERITLAEAMERYIDEPSVRTHKAYRRERDRAMALARGPLGGLRLMALSGRDLADYRDRLLAHGRSANTIRLDLSAIASLYKMALTEWGMQTLRMPVVRKPKLPAGRDRRLEAGEEERLLQAAEAYGGEIGPIIRFALASAMRRGEIAAMRWENVNISKRLVHVVETKDAKEVRGRDVPLSSEALRVLHGLPRRIDGRVWTLAPDGITQAFRRVRQRAGIEGLTFHDLRHEATSRLFEHDWNPMEVAAVTGHKTLQMLKRYTHLRAEELAAKLG